MRIGISCYATLGGSGAVATELGKALAARGHEVHFIVSGIPFRLGLFQENIFIHEVETASYPVLHSSPIDLALAAKMADVIKHYDLHVLHVHYAMPYAVCAFLAREMLYNHPVRIVTTLHGTDITVLAEDPLLRRLIRLGIEKSDLVTAVSKSLIDQTIELFGPRQSMIKISNFVDLQLYKRTTKNEWRKRFSPNGEKVLMHVSNFRPVKRVSDVLATFFKVRESLPAKLILIGEGPDLDAAWRMSEEMGMARDIHFLGKRDEVAALLSAADLLLLPSEKESFGLVALEAMACGVPVIGSLAGGIPEVVEHGKSGLLSPIGDVEDMAKNAQALLSNDRLWSAYSRAARARAAQFSASEIVSSYERLYECLIESSQKSEGAEKGSA
ncbi:N-acetyl-alpha-D-glucosaminyl L-malate synthase BshA [Ferroacidibacillus organovorans]|uniref:N-acetyl-alpha-D-glucosaminyl L-malate synthase BshA n=1 Tax=Ferroacidibacillus organovorans TaxID=1765683 RepID=A0A162TN13_9BACL|nr:N-acetyl-alpha-D-glucosaminyl L-malate synthase BshA [Ferroacidibacillus organovorans]KYP80957.1 N-acetyl-alpha-D-glucosaminyl L-malate synthase BshA [Ferroacidibacillus organovorans]OAG93661.1 N-acetyl-alpha-D-glucosaminyl L-malate synthase BshA [Ferroacidibacillus organovorans]OPG16528.1 N-acetyl-alpha-D-glucosaminyl L-malate synthase BshA [Ferroacidibacillus organovorans]